MNLQKNRDEIFQAVAQATKEAHRSQESVNIIAVTKYVDSSITKDLIKTGIEHIGENRVDKFLEKYEALADQKLTWHLIGSLQRRKVKDIINYLDYFHALDSVKLAEEIQKRATKPIKCFLQVNISREESKHGLLVEEVHSAVQTIKEYEKIELVGIMTMAPFGADVAQLNDIFSKAHALQKELQQLGIPNMPFTELSMGMSGDYKEAIANGSTFVRIGTAFFK
ncbi:YggS family pyridoxal phosphate-dependent enzyme [Streptococcus minor]|uniref:Pyridoxal phosphate homeostasis protein n=1 Tax=Streptococcus minor TaxID=229549 RepID=A0A3P1VF94_9STRE|nr:YggS family pyridoxal phosphate-dependent enzyme [Streptococcus minor]MDO5078079.1 YggS family pyridoxal phosphate-dependent enzyme [Streptococcus minor]RRD31123.1 YggS family pyridoxal phosphate-dependent enzyme [Streptococcus minor]